MRQIDESAIEERVMERTDFLLEHLRQCGQFKCTECLYSYCEDSHVGKLYECRHPQTFAQKGMNDEYTVMRGCACCWFEPMAHAGSYVSLRNSEIIDAVRKLAGYARDKTEWTYDGHTQDERRLTRILNELMTLGVRV